MLTRLHGLRSGGSSHRGGFTLLELALVLTLIGLSAAILLPRLDDPAARVRATQRSLSFTLLAAQQRAVLQQHAVNVLFDTVAALVIVHDDADNDGERESGEAERIYELEKGVRFTRAGVPAGPVGDSVISFSRRIGTLPVVTFGRSGSAREAGGFYLGTARSAAGRKPGDARAVAMERATGHLTGYYLDGAQWKRIGGA